MYRSIFFFFTFICPTRAAQVRVLVINLCRLILSQMLRAFVYGVRGLSVIFSEAARPSETKGTCLRGPYERITGDEIVGNDLGSAPRIEGNFPLTQMSDKGFGKLHRRDQSFDRGIPRKTLVSKNYSVSLGISRISYSIAPRRACLRQKLLNNIYTSDHKIHVKERTAQRTTST